MVIVRAMPMKDGQFDFRVVQTEDGSITPERAERMALMMADDVSEPRAWKNLGGGDKGGSHQYRKRITSNPVFKLRLEELMSEREAMEQDPVWGKARWMIEQLYREARAVGDIQMMSKAVEMRLRVAEKTAGQSPAPSPAPTPAATGEEEEAQSGPGRPLTARHKDTANVADITDRLMKMGMSNVVPPAAVTDAA